MAHVCEWQRQCYFAANTRHSETNDFAELREPEWCLGSHQHWETYVSTRSETVILFETLTAISDNRTLFVKTFAQMLHNLWKIKQKNMGIRYQYTFRQLKVNHKVKKTALSFYHRISVSTLCGACTKSSALGMAYMCRGVNFGTFWTKTAAIFVFPDLSVVYVTTAWLFVTNFEWLMSKTSIK